MELICLLTKSSNIHTLNKFDSSISMSCPLPSNSLKSFAVNYFHVSADFDFCSLKAHFTSEQYDIPSYNICKFNACIFELDLYNASHYNILRNYMTFFLFSHAGVSFEN